MSNISYRIAIALAAAALAAPAAAQDRQTERTFKERPGAARPPATIADMAWLAGHWTGQALGGTIRGDVDSARARHDARACTG